MLYFICYDIAHDRRRRRLTRVLEGYGHRLHESAFHARLRPAQLSRLNQRIAALLDPVADRLTIYPLCGRDEPDRRHVGQHEHAEPTSAVVV